MSEQKSVGRSSEPESSKTSAEEILADAYSDLEPDIEKDKLVSEARDQLYVGASDPERFEACIQVTTSHIDRDPEMKKVAAEVFLQKYYREVIGGYEEDTFEERYREVFARNIRRMVSDEILDERMLAYDLDSLAEQLRPERDRFFDYMALDTLYQRYFLKNEDERLELPQAFWMRVAMGVALQEPVANRQERAVEFYEKLSKLKFVHSTPTLFHAGTTHPQLSSCYLTTVEDDLEHIFKSYQDHALLSKWSGGLGNDWTNVRAEGSLIESTGVESTGTVPFLKISNDVTHAINRSGKRRGAAAAYLEAWHLDFPDFLDLKRNTGDERRRTHDMNTAAWVPDLFMKRVEEDGEWTLFSPDEVPELHSIYGKEFEEKYREYEEKAEEGDLRQYENVEARSLWRTMLTRLFETGHPWITFKDPCNIRSPQDHAGTVHSSNLCTEITLNTSEDETAVCNLGSVNLAKHVDENGLKAEELKDTISTAMRMLDNVVDLCFYPTEEAENSNMKHRPVGLGVMGFHDALIQQRISMASEEALEFADMSQEFIAYHAIMNSSKLAEERGSYESFEGSKWDRDILPQDSLDLLQEERGRDIPLPGEERLEWGQVRSHIQENGMRNSNVMAVAPTATISTITGVSPSIEPRYSNLYVKSNMSGDFTVINDYLVDDLKSEGLWDEQMMEEIKARDGSIQGIERIPEEIREVHRGAFEIDPRHQIKLTAHRMQWIDQSVSHDVFFPSTDGRKLDSVYRTAWEWGLKTTYYLRSLGASQIEKSTVDMEKYGKTQKSRDGGDS